MGAMTSAQPLPVSTGMNCRSGAAPHNIGRSPGAGCRAASSTTTPSASSFTRSHDLCADLDELLSQAGQ